MRVGSSDHDNQISNLDVDFVLFAPLSFVQCTV